MKAALDRFQEVLAVIYHPLWLKIEEQKAGEVQRTKEVLAILLFAYEPIQKSHLEAMASDLYPEAKSVVGEEWTLSPNDFIEGVSQDRVQTIHTSAVQYLQTTNVLDEVDRGTLYDPTKHTFHEPKARSQPLPYGTEDSKSLSSSNLQKSVDEFNDTAFLDSWSSAFSQETSLKSSQSNKSYQLKAVTDQFAKLFTEHNVTGPLIIEILHAAGAEGFQQFLSSALVQYSKVLQPIAKTGSGQIAEVVVGKKASAIAHQTVEIFDSFHDRKTLAKSPTVEEQAGKEQIIKQFLELQDRDKGAKSEKQSKLPITDWSADERWVAVTESANDNVFRDSIAQIEKRPDKFNVDLQTVKGFLIMTGPFLVLGEKLR